MPPLERSIANSCDMIGVSHMTEFILSPSRASLSTILILAVLILPALLVTFAACSAWRDPANWVLDAESRKIRYRNWIELAAYLAILAVTLLCLLLFLL